MGTVMWSDGDSDMWSDGDSDMSDGDSDVE